MSARHSLLVLVKAILLSQGSNNLDFDHVFSLSGKLTVEGVPNISNTPRKFLPGRLEIAFDQWGRIHLRYMALVTEMAAADNLVVLLAVSIDVV